MAAGGFGIMNRLGYARPNAATANAQQPNNEMQTAMFKSMLEMVRRGLKAVDVQQSGADELDHAQRPFDGADPRDPS
jgi:hypothetical protein